MSSYFVCSFNIFCIFGKPWASKTKFICVLQIFSQRPIQKEAVDLCVQLFQAFAGTLDNLAQLGNVERATKRYCQI